MLFYFRLLALFTLLTFPSFSAAISNENSPIKEKSSTKNPAKITQVIVFELKGTGFSKGVLETISAELRASIGTLSYLEVKDKALMDNQMKEDGLSASECKDLSCQIEFAGALGVDEAVTGQIRKIGEMTSIILNRVDIVSNSTKSIKKKRINSQSLRVILAEVETLSKELFASLAKPKKLSSRQRYKKYFDKSVDEFFGENQKLAIAAKLGFNISGLDHWNSSTDFEFNKKLGFSIGVGSIYQLKNKLNFELDLLYSTVITNFSSKELGVGLLSSIQYKTILIPASLSYFIYGSHNYGFKVKVGGFLGLNSEDLDINLDPDFGDKLNLSTATNFLSYGLNLGFGYKAKMFGGNYFLFEALHFIGFSQVNQKKNIEIRAAQGDFLSKGHSYSLSSFNGLVGYYF